MRTITLTIPSFPSFSFIPEVKSSLKSIKNRVSSQIYSFTDYADTSAAKAEDKSLPKASHHLNQFFEHNKKNMKFVPIVVIALVLMLAVGLFLRSSNRTVLGDNDKVSIEKSDKTQEVNKNFTFPVLDSQGDEAGKLQYTVQSAELRDQLVIKGQEAKAVEGRTFLIITIKLKNDTEHLISVNTRDFIRLKLNGSDELLAPTIHNDPVEAQAISTLTTRVGFSVPDDQTEKMSLQIGEISKDKQTVELNFN